MEPHSHQQSHEQELQHHRVGVARAVASVQHRAGKWTVYTPETEPAELKHFCACSLTRCRRISFLWNNRSPHSRPTWKASQRPVRMDLQGDSLTLKRPVPPIQRQAMHHWSPRARHLHLHLFLPLIQTRVLQRRLCTFPPPSDNCINLERRNDCH